MWANRESYLPVKAWPNWTANRAEVRSWADDLARDPRESDAPSDSRFAPAAGPRRLPTSCATRRWEAPEYTATCDAAYMRLGYELGYGQQVLGIADEAARNGDRALARQARQDGMSHLQNSSRILSEYERIVSLTGRCADLRDVRTQLDAIYPPRHRRPLRPVALDNGCLDSSRSSASSRCAAGNRPRRRRLHPPPTPFFPPLPPHRHNQRAARARPRRSPPAPIPVTSPACGSNAQGNRYDESYEKDRLRPEMPWALALLPACLRDGPGPTSRSSFAPRWRRRIHGGVHEERRSVCREGRRWQSAQVHQPQSIWIECLPV